jgi:hypothetical protein
MANKKVSQLTSKPAVNLTDLFLIADPTSGQAFKTTISDLGTAIGSGVSSVNTLVGAVVLDTDDIQELASPTNRWFTDTRARAALSASSPLAYNSGTGVFSIPQATGSQNGYLTSTDWTTFNAKQAALSGTGFVKISGTTISYDNSTYLTTSAAASTYLALAGGTLTGALNGTSANFSGDLTLTGTNPRFYLTDSDNNPDYFISNTDGTFTVYDVTNSTSRFTINGNLGTFGGNLTVGQIIRSGGTSSQFLKADGSVDSTAYLPLTGGTLTGALTLGTATGDNQTLLNLPASNKLIYREGVGSLYGFNIDSSNDNSLFLTNTEGGYYQTLYFGDGDSLNIFGISSSDNSGSTWSARFVVNQNGFIGLNKNNPNEILDVAGNGLFSGSLTANSIVKSGGTSSQFLKADGSVDSSTYLTTGSASSTYLPLSGGTLTGNLGVGVVPTVAELQVGKSSDVTIAMSNSSSVTSGNRGQLVWYNSSNSTVAFIRAAAVTDNVGTELQFHTRPASGSVTQSMVINSTGNIAIGASSPGDSRLMISGTHPSGNAILRVQAVTTDIATIGLFGTAGTRKAIFIYNDSTVGIETASDPLNFGTNGSTKMQITTGGQIFMYNLSSGAGTNAARYSTATGQLTYDTSSARYKDNIRDSVYGLSDVLKMRSAMFEYKENNRTDVGLIAEELYTIIPELVGIDKSGKPDSVSYDRLVSVLIKSVQELNDKVKTLENK